jgi:hypothetical protein
MDFSVKEFSAYLRARGLAESTIDNYVRYVDLMAGYHGHPPLTFEDVERWTANYTRRIAASSLRMYKTAMRRYVEMLNERD